jgi:hypothetical protein
VLLLGQDEREIGGEPINVSLDLFVEPLHGHTVEICEIRIEDDSLATQDEDRALGTFKGDARPDEAGHAGLSVEGTEMLRESYLGRFTNLWRHSEDASSTGRETGRRFTTFQENAGTPTPVILGEGIAFTTGQQPTRHRCLPSTQSRIAQE